MNKLLKLIPIIHLCVSGTVSAECRGPLESMGGAVGPPSSELNLFLEDMIGKKYYDENATLDFEKPTGCFELKHGYKVPLTKTCASKKGEHLSIGITLDEKYHIDTVKQAIETKFPAIEFHYESSEKHLLKTKNSFFKTEQFYNKFLFIQVYNAYGQVTDRYTSKLSNDDKPTMIRYEFLSSTKAVKDYELCVAKDKKIMNKKLIL